MLNSWVVFLFLIVSFKRIKRIPEELSPLILFLKKEHSKISLFYKMKLRRMEGGIFS